MKRAVTILLIISQLLIFSSCDQNTTTFTESNHPRSESYNATFDTMCKTEGNLTVHIAEEVYEEKNADKVFQQIKEDYDKVIKVTGQKENPVTVYIVSKTKVKFKPFLIIIFKSNVKNCRIICVLCYKTDRANKNKTIIGKQCCRR